MGTLHRHRIGKESEGTGWDSNPRRRITGAGSSPLDDRCTRTIRVGPEGLEPSPARLRAGGAAANTWVPASTTESVGSGGLEPPSPVYRPGALPLSYRPSPLRASMGSEGLEPPPSGLKVRRAAVTPRPRRFGERVAMFEPDHQE